MPTDASIILQGRPVPLQDPAAQLMQVLQYRNALQDQQLGALKIQQVQAAVQQQAEQQKREDAFRASLVSPQAQATQAALAGGGGPTLANAAKMPPVDPQQQLMFNAMQARLVSPMDYVNGLRKDTTPIKLGAGETLVQPGTFKPLASNPKEQELTADFRNYQQVRTQGYQGTFEQFLREQANLKAPKTTVSVNTGQKGFDNTLKLRSDFRSEPIYKAHQEMQSAYSQIQQSLKQGNAAGDLAGATKIMKLLDPGSVVRESELGMAMAATGMLDRVTNYANSIITGQKLTPKQRQEFQALADALFGESVKQYNAKRAEYAQIAGRNELNIEDVVGQQSPSPVAAGGWSIKPK